MSRTDALVCLVVLLCGSASWAQEIRVQKKPAPKTTGDVVVVYDDWTVSFSRRHAPKVFELYTFCASEEAARKEANRLAARDKKRKDDDWKIAVILIEGHPTVKRPRTTSGPRLALPKPRRKPGDVLGEYKKQVEEAYRRAKNAKHKLLGLTTSITVDDFRQVNALIDSYNNERNAIRTQSGYYFSSAPSLTRVRLSDLKAEVVPYRNVKKGPEGKRIDGTTWDYSSGGRGFIKLELGGVFKESNAAGDRIVYEGTWSIRDGFILISVEDTGNGSGGQTFRGTAKGNRITGKWTDLNNLTWSSTYTLRTKK